METLEENGNIGQKWVNKKKIKIRFKSNGTYSGNKNSIAPKT